MTDLAPLVITASVLTIILQIVLIILVLDSKKKAKVVHEEKPANHEIREPRKPRENENRYSRKPLHDQRVRPAPAAAAATATPTQNPDQMERSLRDINLRLKNAEQDQEKERRRIKDSIGNQPQQKRNDFSKQRDRNEGFRRNDRPPRQDFQQRLPAESNKPFVREEKPDKVPSPIEPKEIKTPNITPAVVAAIPVMVSPSTSPVSPEQTTKPSNQLFEVESSGIANAENLQHGRKVAVKRRVLKAEEQIEASESTNEKEMAIAPSGSAASSTNITLTPIQENIRQIDSVTTTESNSSETSKPEAPIGFGR